MNYEILPHGQIRALQILIVIIITSPQLAGGQLHRADKRCPLHWPERGQPASSHAIRRREWRMVFHKWGILIGWRLRSHGPHEHGVPSTPGRRCQDTVAALACAVTHDTNRTWARTHPLPGSLSVLRPSATEVLCSLLSSYITNGFCLYFIFFNIILKKKRG